MAKYAIGIRNVRSKFEPSASGTKDAPVAGSLYTVHNGTAPTAGECKAMLQDLIPQLDDATATSVGTNLSAAHANATVRADETTGADSFRWGKAVYQFGVGYHATVDATAITSVNWKNLS